MAINDFVDNTLAKENVTAAAQSNPKLTHIISNIILIDTIDQNYISETIYSITLINNMASEVLFDLPFIPKKPSKWDYLPRRNMSIYM